MPACKARLRIPTIFEWLGVQRSSHMSFIRDVGIAILLRVSVLWVDMSLTSSSQSAAHPVLVVCSVARFTGATMIEKDKISPPLDDWLLR